MISVDFNNYNVFIKKEIEKLNYEVDEFVVNENYSKQLRLAMRIKTDPKDEDSLNKIYFDENKKKFNIKFFRFLNKKTDKNYDFVLVIKGTYITKDIMRLLKKNYSSAKFILYQWDDIERVDSFFNICSYFDQIYSFDLRDVKKHNLKHLPLFYINSCSEKEDKIYDLSMIAGLSEERENILNQIIEQGKDLLKNNFLYLYKGDTFSRVRSIIKNNGMKEPRYYKYKLLPLKKNLEIVNKSRILLDVQRPSQSGLTMRTFEAVGANCKLITTNFEVRKYDFYNPENILVIDRKNPMIDIDFIKKPYKSLPQKIYEKYTLENWVKTLLDVSNKER